MESNFTSGVTRPCGKRRLYTTQIFFLVALLIAWLSIDAQTYSGQFGIAKYDRYGKVVTNFSSTRWESAEAVTIPRSNKIVVAGIAGYPPPSGPNYYVHPPNSWFALAEYNYNGRLNPEFDEDGKVLTNIRGSQSEGAKAVGVGREDRIVVAGYAIEY